MIVASQHVVYAPRAASAQCETFCHTADRLLIAYSSGELACLSPADGSCFWSLRGTIGLPRVLIAGPWFVAFNMVGGYIGLVEDGATCSSLIKTILAEDAGDPVVLVAASVDPLILAIGYASESDGTRGYLARVEETDDRAPGRSLFDALPVNERRFPMLSLQQIHRTGWIIGDAVSGNAHVIATRRFDPSGRSSIVLRDVQSLGVMKQGEPDVTIHECCVDRIAEDRKTIVTECHSALILTSTETLRSFARIEKYQRGYVSTCSADGRYVAMGCFNEVGIVVDIWDIHRMVRVRQLLTQCSRLPKLSFSSQSTLLWTYNGGNDRIVGYHWQYDSVLNVPTQSSHIHSIVQLADSRFWIMGNRAIEEFSIHI